MRQNQTGKNLNGARIDPRLTLTTACANDSSVSSAGGFGPGTLIITDQGEVPVEWLAAGDRVLTRDDGHQPLVRVERRRLAPAHFRQHPEDCPVRVPAGMLAPCAPERDLQVSGHHRVLVRAMNARHSSGQTELLAPAHAWADLGLAENVVPQEIYTFTHLFCDAHQIIHAQGTWVQSSSPMQSSRSAVGDAVLLCTRPRRSSGAEPMEPARPCLERHEAHAVIHAIRDGRFRTFPDTVFKRA
jgi:hypothetical protein